MRSSGWAAAVAVLGLLWFTACEAPPPLVVGRAGVTDGAFRSPRGVAVSDAGLAVLDRTGRLQLFTLDGAFVSSLEIVGGDVRRGLPIGCAWLDDGRIAVAETHQSRVRLIPMADGEEAALRDEAVLGDYGVEPGQFLYPQRIAPAGPGMLVVSDHGMGATNRIQRIRHDGTPVAVFGGPDEVDGGLIRPMGVVVLPDGGTLVADQRAGIVRFAADGALLGRLPEWPFGPEVVAYGLTRAPDGTLFCTDLTGHRVIRMSADGAPEAQLGGMGTEPGRFREPWDVAWHAGRLYVADMGNNRVQRFDVEDAAWEDVE